MSVKLEIPTFEKWSMFTTDGIAFEFTAKESRFARNSNAGKLRITPESEEGIAASARSWARLVGRVIKEGQQILADSNNPIEAKAKLIDTSHYQIVTFSPGEFNSIIEYYGTRINRDYQDSPWLQVRLEKDLPCLDDDFTSFSVDSRLRYILTKSVKPNV